MELEEPEAMDSRRLDTGHRLEVTAGSRLSLSAASEEDWEVREETAPILETRSGSTECC